ncbi:hypothetical protein PI86_11030 [Burkholderia sp. A9]|uniref:hypothetical protein n=1 Tax=Burkholderia sp. A9 TaxID=1365108 RepID=UPI00057412B3|nr:hypothetical protein [Burkholderia sp. A9]KHK58137.1 hypothetical protein PI86_11030 [Burkholderia sp. A9]
MTDRRVTEAEAIGYALAKQVPDMERGFTIQTSYGNIEIGAEDAGQVAALVRKILQRKLACVEVRHA